uniref:efflux RND transporter periplasmic adaptor subunit n=1 Tax=Ornithobacterium rhinotracheale TaxID=28251 RepID=UPI0039A72580
MKKIFVILTLTVLAACSSKTEETPETFQVSENQDQITLTELQFKNANIEVKKLSEQDIANKITLFGSIDVPPQGMASVSAPSGGYVRMSKYMPGNFIKKGEVLAVLEDPNVVQLQQDYLLAKSNLSYAQKDFQRQKELNKSQASSDKTMQLAQTEAQNQHITLKAMAERLRILGINPDKINAQNIQKSISVRSPISGYISAVNVNLGQYVSPTDRLFEIVNTSDLHLILKVFEKDLSHIKKGQLVFAYTNQNPEKKYRAEIILIGQNFDADRSIPVHCHFIGEEPKLASGTFMNAEIETNSQTGIAIPDEAIVTWEGKQYIFEEVKPQTYKMFPVTIGNSENGHTEIFGDMASLEQKRFVTNGAYTLLMGLKNVEE